MRRMILTMQYVTPSCVPAHDMYGYIYTYLENTLTLSDVSRNGK